MQITNRLLGAATALFLGACGNGMTTMADGGPPAVVDMAKAQDDGPPGPIRVKLDPPAPGEGFQLKSDDIQVGSGQEVQSCHFFKAPDLNGDGSAYFVDKIVIAQNVGSHHVNIFRVKSLLGLKPPNADGTGSVIGWRDYNDPVGPVGSPEDMAIKMKQGECFKSPNWADWPLVANNQDSNDGKNYVFQLPAEVGHKFTPGEPLMIQSHFVNATTQVAPGGALSFANFMKSKADPAKIQELGTVFATKQSIKICPNNPTPTFTGFCRFNNLMQGVTVAGANAHFHSRGTKFTMQTWDGVSVDPSTGMKFYESFDWEDPPMMTGLQIGIPAGQGISYSCSFKYAEPPGGCKNIADPDCCYNFGPTVEGFEHCNVFVYYYPKVASTDIMCN